MFMSKKAEEEEDKSRSVISQKNRILHQ